ncbi:MAG: DUF927 domain-containing protein [Clostridiales bacterium]|nr:DUF927 domain-containing protein [Clostridiales bacterium]
MVPLENLTRESILSDEVFTEVFEQEDLIYRERLLISLKDRAKELGVKTQFDAMERVFKAVLKTTLQKTRKKAMIDNWTNFSGDYDNMKCGSWLASDDGIYTFNKDYDNEVIVCYHPILPIKRLQNMQTGEERLKIAFKRNHVWKEIIVNKDLVSSASKIVALSKLGVAVTSENAKLLVKYLSDVENLNDDCIPVQKSTAKLGWIDGTFVPYDDDVIFDGDVSFRYVYESIKSCGGEKEWMDYVKKLRKTNRIEILLSLSVSFASVLIGLLDMQPFIFDLWGETGYGKSVSMMLAASVWGNPGENQFIGDFKSTDVQLEVRADMLNHLPVLLDDSSKVNDKLRDNFEGFVYSMCSGKGKSRSTKDLGIRRENTWKNIIMTNGEHPLESYVYQGGAINRILEIECKRTVYDDVAETIGFLLKNYGFAGRRFIKIVKAMGVEAVREIRDDIQSRIFEDGKPQKQGVALSILLTADRIIADFLFKDGIYIPIEEAMEMLTDESELSENERCYQYLLDKVSMNPQRFDLDSNVEKWGVIDKGYAIFYVQAFKDLCKAGNFSAKSFFPWADRKELIQTQNGKPSKVKKIEGHSCKCIFLKLREEGPMEGFEDVDQGKLPFM